MEHLSQFAHPPILIGGCGRSGTALMRVILSAHPNICAIHDETRAFTPGAYGDSRTQFSPDKIDEALSLLTPTPRQRRWCEKTPKNVKYFEKILAYFSNEVRLIHIVRDARDVVTSIHHHNPYDFWVSPSRWFDDVSSGLAFAGHPQVFTLRYEDLILHFEKTITQLCSFLDEDVCDEIMDWPRYATVRRKRIPPKLDPKSIRKWLDPKHPHIETIKKVVSGVMDREDIVSILDYLGYLEPTLEYKDFSKAIWRG